MATKQLTAPQKAALKLFKERLGGISEEKKMAQRLHTTERKAVLAVLERGPATVPDIARSTEIAPGRVLWHLTAMRKYGALREVDVDGDYARYEYIATEQPGE